MGEWESGGMRVGDWGNGACEISHSPHSTILPFSRSPTLPLFPSPSLALNPAVVDLSVAVTPVEPYDVRPLA
jgi:hypothetical protein